MESVVASSVRSGLRQGAQPASPHTPNRYLSSTFSSPGSFRQEEDAVIIEIGSRYLRAGFEGESSPQCVITFGREDSRRVGDYRGVNALGFSENCDFDSWGQGHELWDMDVRGLDLGLVEDRLERAVREAYNKHLLADIGSARLVLVLPSVLPHPLLSSLLSTLFTRWKYSSITLMPSPAMCVVSAGLRSALVVDIGWMETVVSALYEYREIRTKRSTRSVQTVLKGLGQSLSTWLRAGGKSHLKVSFEFTEDLLVRFLRCRQTTSSPTGYENPRDASEYQSETEKSAASPDTDIEVDWPTEDGFESISIPSKVFSYPLESALLLSTDQSHHPDDQEGSLPGLIYETLLSLPPDARSICMARLLFVGGGSNIAGLSRRLTEEVGVLIKTYGWSAVRGSAAVKEREKLKDIGQGRTETPDFRFRDETPPGQDNPIEVKVRKHQAKVSPVQGELRQVDSLGAWAGASLLASLKVKGFVEIEREKFLQHGMGGAQRNIDVSVVPQRASYGGGLNRGGGDRTNWTLAGWG